MRKQKKSISKMIIYLCFFFLQENDREIIRKRTKRSLENNRRTIARDTRGPGEVTQEDLDNVADFANKKVYNQVTVCVLARTVACWVLPKCAKDRYVLWHTLPILYTSFFHSICFSCR